MSNLQSGANKAQMIELLNSIKIPIMGAGGGFAPIGTESYFDGTSAPQGWILCDGSVLNIADYPELATYYASHYGESNHFGGDGVTTFAVPTREGMPSGGVKTTEEHIVGEWRETVDGVLKRKPMYEKTVSVNTVVSNDNVDTGYVFSNANIKKISGVITYTTNVTANINRSGAQQDAWVESNGHLMVLNKNFAGVMDITLAYTKSTDSWTLPTPGHSSDGNGVFCVKATVSGDANGEVYSTDEHVCGHDEDNGDIVYERTIKTVVPNSSNATVMEFSNKKLKEIKGVVKWDTGSDSAEESLPYFTATNDCCRLRMKNNNIICTYGGSQFVGQRLEFTIRYIKTS